MEAGEAALELVDEGDDGGILGVEEEDLLGGDDGLDVLEVDDDGALAAEDGGGVGKERVEDPQIAGGKASPAHDRVLPCFHHLGLTGGVDHEPGPDPYGLLSEPRGWCWGSTGGVHHLVLHWSNTWLGSGRGRRRASSCTHFCSLFLGDYFV